MAMGQLTVAEVAARLRVKPLTVRLWLRAGSLVGNRCEERAACRVSESELIAFLDARRRGGVQERNARQAPAQ
jgi:excisionase family DNA binding protein